MDATRPLGAGEQDADPRRIVRKQIEHRRLVGSQHVEVDGEELRDDLVHSLSEHPRSRIKIAHDGQTRRRRRNGVEDEIGSVLLEGRVLVCFCVAKSRAAFDLLIRTAKVYLRSPRRGRKVPDSSDQLPVGNLT